MIMDDVILVLANIMSIELIFNLTIISSQVQASYGLILLSVLPF